MKKRLISLFIAVLIVLGTCIFAVAETQEKSDEFEFLSVTGFGLDLSEPEKLLTRADLAKLAINLKGVSTIKDGEPICYDVPKKHWAFPIVNTVMYYGLMGPGADGLFHPDRTATVMDGSRILMGLLGYDEIGKAANWNDSTYYNKARSLGLFRGVKDTKDGLTIRALASMAINMLSIPVAKVTSIEGDASQYAVDEKNTFIKENYGYEIIEGVVQAVGEQTLSGIAKVNQRSIKINGNIYNSKGKNYLKYLGMDVKAIIDPESSVVLAIAADIDYEEIIVPAKDILSYKNFEFRYVNEKEKEKIIDVPKDCEIVLNGQTVSKYNEKDFMPVSGEVRFVDKDNDGIYEMVYITSDIYLKVNGIYEGERLIDAVTAQIIELDEVNVQCVKDGVAINVSDIGRGSIIAVRAGALTYEDNVPKVDNAKVKTLEIELLDKTVSGTVTGVADGGEGGYEIDGVYYEVSDYYKGLIADGVVNAPDAGSIVDFYLNNDNEIVLSGSASRFSPKNENLKYAYLMGIDEGAGVNKNLTLKVITTEKKAEVLEVATKFYVNDVRATSNDALLKNAQLYQGGVFKRQLIRYQLDSEGKLRAIYIAKNYANEKIYDINGTEMDNPNYNIAGYEGYDDESFALNYFKEELTWNLNINHQYTLSDDTVVFIVPQDPDNLDAWEVSDRTYIKNEQKYPFAAYDANERLEFGAVVVDYSSGGSANKNLMQTIYYAKIGSCMITGKKSKMMGEDVVTCLTGKTYGVNYMQFQGWQGVELIPSTPDLADADSLWNTYIGTKLSDLEPGDVIEYQLDVEGKIERFRVLAKKNDLYDADGNLKYGSINSYGVMNGLYVGRGKVTKLFDDGSFTFSTNAEGKFSGLLFANQHSGLMSRGMIRVFIFDTRSERVTLADTSQLRVGDEGFLRSEDGQALDIFVYR